MPNPLKYIEHGALHLVTSRSEDGLPFMEVERFRPIFESILARAQYLYPVHIVAFILLSNHFHLLLIPQDPELFPLFVGYLKQELAHALNRINGRKKKTIWCEGYDSPILLGFEEALHYLTYTYTQAQSAHLCSSAEDYRGACSWDMFITGVHEKECPRRSRTAPDEVDSSFPAHTLTISPYGWLPKLNSSISPEELKSLLVSHVRAKEEELCEERKKLNITVGSSSGKGNPEKYIPVKRGKRMYCICWNNEYRILFLNFISTMVERCRETLRAWKNGMYDAIWPPGLFPPRASRRANLLPSLDQLCLGS